jgi:hypothetical protein
VSRVGEQRHRAAEEPGGSLRNDKDDIQSYRNCEGLADVSGRRWAMVMMAMGVAMPMPVRMTLAMSVIGVVVMMLVCDAHAKFIACAGP